MVRFLNKAIPLWSAILLLVLIGGLFAVVFIVYQSVTYNYNLVLSNGGRADDLVYGSWPALEDADFFNKVKNDFVAQKTNFIEANLSTMQLRLYQDGQVEKEVPILSKGKVGSWWETPAGLYKIELKEENHFSSFGKVYQPWSMVFQGNFFIHGWPYYPDGPPVAEGYSGGCIRLADEDAKAVYALAQTGMPVLVYENDFIPENVQYEITVPGLTAPYYLAVDLKSNVVLLEKGSEITVPIASITKLMTALVAAEYINLDNEVMVTRAMIVPTSQSRLYPGQRISAYQLLFPLLMESSNEAAEALAAMRGRSWFIQLMNKKAEALGLKDTHFTDPAGSDPGNRSTAQDMFHLLKYLYNNRSFILKMTTGELTRSAYGSPQFSGLGNFNIISGLSGFLGGKTGQTTAAGKTMAALYQIKIGAELRPIAIVVFGAEDNFADVKAIYNWIKDNYRITLSNGTSI